MEYLSILLLLISIGSMNIHRVKNSDALIENSISGKLLLTIIPLISFIIISILISKIFSIKWYWSIFIAIIGVFILSGLLAKFYSLLLGYKTKPQLSLLAGGYVKHNLHIIDSVITFVLGLILFFLFT